VLKTIWRIGGKFVSWNQQFFDPIELPSGRKLVTLREAALFITELPKAEHDAEEWQWEDEPSDPFCLD